jgi:hypothetical protein
MNLRAAFLSMAVAALALGCSQETDPLAVRALSQSGRSAFVCLGPSDEPAPGRSITDCSGRLTGSPDDFGLDDENKVTLPHLYALVTQTKLGEVAVVDLTATQQSIVDVDPGTPGANFLPVGAQPVDIVASPGGTAAFVAIAEVGHQAIMALPTKQIRPCPTCAPPKLSSWPGCSLPSAPGEMLVVSDPVDRHSCSAAPGEVDDPEAPEGLAESHPDLDLSREKRGRQKLIVTLPELGKLVVIDAQRLLDGRAKSAEAGAPPPFEACVFEKELSLQVSAGALPPPPATDHGAACVDPKAVTPAAKPLAKPRPAGLALADDRLFIGDLDAPVVHVIGLPTPCEPTELPPLLPTSQEEPDRVVTTSRLAVSGLVTPELRRYLYAVDGGDGSVMVFDVSDGASARTPLSRQHPEWNPLQPADRIRYNAAVRDLVIVQRDVPASLPATGVAPEGIRCNPDPLLKCDTQNASCDIEALYRTAASYDSGAGPLKLRGTFAFLLLTSGQVTVIDIDDLDAACRGPKVESALAGCASPLAAGELATSDEASCNVVMQHAARDASYVVSSTSTNAREPGLLLYPILYDGSGAVLPVSSETPKMRATLPSDGGPTPTLSIGTNRQVLDESGLLVSAGELRHALLMNLEDPRAQAFDQNWFVTYEGVLPDFGQSYVEFRALDANGNGVIDDASNIVDASLIDPDARFCERGVQSAGSAQDQSFDRRFGDVAQITSDLPDESDSKHWSKALLDGKSCLDACQKAYSGFAASRPELPIQEAFEDRVILEVTKKNERRNDEVDPVQLAKCCFPGKVQFNIRARSQWIVRGEQSGFLHHVIADPASGRCRNSCDARVSRLNGRVRQANADGPVKDGDELAFINPLFRFAITAPPNSDVSKRNMQFRLTTQGSFTPLAVSLGSALELQPQSIRFIPATGELAIADGALEGLILMGGSSIVVSRSIF